MEKIRIENLRSLKDTGQVELKPINVLVGGNSSGKSTFLRFFPLVKQSLGRKINGPILWAGEADDYVDFGSFDEALNYNSGDGKIKFGFEITVPYRFKSEDGVVMRYVLYSIEYYIAKKNTDFDYLFQIDFQFDKRRISVFLDKTQKVKSVSIEERKYEIKEFDWNRSWDEINGSIFDISLMDVERYANREIVSQLSLDIEELINNNYYCEENIKVMDIIDYFTAKVILGDIVVGIKYGEKIESHYGAGINDIETFKDMLLLKCALIMYRLEVSGYLNEYFHKIYYIAPFRDVAKRYNRVRNSFVNEVDCRGSNLPVFLNSLPEIMFKDFQEWTKVHFGFCVEKTLDKVHVSLKVKKRGASKAFNLVDEGFGYSQILPFITELWYISSEQIKTIGEVSDIPTTIAIEQPELHLHPALQAKLVDVIVSVMQNSEGNIRFIIETHSETIINRLGNLIYKEKLNKDQVNVMIFNKALGDDDSTIQFGNFDEEGYLENWPAGFFEPEEVQ